MHYHDGMKFARVASGAGLRGTRKVTDFFQCREERTAFRVVGWTSMAIGIAALGLYVGHELRSRYKFRRRTPYDYFSHAGDSVPAADYGMGV